jgi:hypothetical protein
VKGKIMTFKPKIRIRACALCGGKNVWGSTWIELNTGKVVGDEAPVTEKYCPDCDTFNVEIKYV